MNRPLPLAMTGKRGSCLQPTAANRLDRENFMHLLLTLEIIKLTGLYLSAWIMGFSKPMTGLTGKERPGGISHPPPQAPLRLLAVAAVLLVLTLAVPWVAHAQTPTNEAATGQPKIVASAEGAPYLFADTSGIRDGNGLPLTDPDDAGGVIEFIYSYQWIQVDGMTETNVGDGSARYHLVDADYGKLIKVTVSFTDQDSFSETVTSDPFRPVRREDTSLSPATLVSNTGQTNTADATITKQYAMGFTLGTHGQGYELSGVSIELAAVPTALSVSLWIADHADKDSTLESRLYDFKNPASIAVGANEFKAPPGVLLHQNIQYAVVLSGYTSLMIRETTSDAEDAGGEEGAVLVDEAQVRDLGTSGRWDGASDRETGTSPRTETPVLRLAIKGSQRASGILASTYGQTASGHQEIMSIGDKCCIRVNVGSADRYLVRGFSWNADDSTVLGGGMTNPWELREGSNTGDELYRLFITRNIAGVPEWSAPQGATVAGGSDNTYFFSQDWDAYDHVEDGSRTGHALTRAHGTESTDFDVPTTPGVSFSETGDISIPQYLAAVLGEPLYAMVQNLGQDDNDYVEVDSTNKVVTQGFTTGSKTGGYRLQGIGVNIEGSVDANSVAQVPDDGTSVSVALYTADADGEPESKQFDLINPTEYAAGHSFFEAPPATTLDANKSYVLVWSHTGGTAHRLQKTSSNDEDPDELSGFGIADAFFAGADLDNLTIDSLGQALEIAVYTDTSRGSQASGEPRVLASAEGAPYLFADTSRIADEDGIPFTPADGVGNFIDFTYSYQWIRVDSGTEAETNIGDGKSRYRLVDADMGHLIKVEVSFTDLEGYSESVTSLPFGPVVRPAALASPATLVSNTGQSDTADATISEQYAQEFKLGDHGQGYEISSVSIDLAAAPNDLTVSLWIGNHSNHSSVATTRLFDFENPPNFQVGLNKFTAPPGVLAYQRVRYYIVLSDFGSSLSVRETASDNEDAGGETGAELADTARLRDQGESGRWGTSTERTTGENTNTETPVLRLAIKGSQRDRGVLVSSYAQPFDGDQEIISIPDRCCFSMNVGAADRYLIRGFSWNSDDTKPTGGGITNPWDLREETYDSDTDETIVTKLVRLINTRNAAGITEWTAPQGATVPGGSGQAYTLGTDWDFPYHLEGGTRTGAALTRTYSTQDGNTGLDTPTAAGVALAQYGDVAVTQPVATVLGEPLHAMVQNLGQADNFHENLGSLFSVASQGFTTGTKAGRLRAAGHRRQHRRLHQRERHRPST